MSGMADDATNDHLFPQTTEPGQIQSDPVIVHEANAPSLPASTIRPQLVTIAVAFLKDNRSTCHSVDQKKDFLLKKGLNPSEIDLALNIADNQPNHLMQVQQFHQPSAIQMYPPSMPYHPLQGPLYPSGLQMIRTLVPPLVMAYGTIYGLYMLYKKYIEPKLFGPPAKHPLILVMESITKLQESVDAIRSSLEKMEDNIVTRLKDHITKFNQISSSERLAASDLKKELASLKALLLGRNNFPETPLISNIGKKIQEGSGTVNASIPSWQLAVEGEKERQ